MRPSGRRSSGSRARAGAWSTCDSSGVRPERARRPAYLLSGLLKCGACGGGFSKVSQDHYGCSTARNRGTCANLLIIRRDVVEASVLSGLRTHLMHPDLVKEFIAEYQREINRMNAQVEETHARHKVELAQVERQIRAIVEAIKDGLRTAAMKDELLLLEARKQELSSRSPETPATAVRLHPNLAEIYRQKVARLHEELNRPELREEAAAAIRGLIEEVRLVPVEGKLRDRARRRPGGDPGARGQATTPAARGSGSQVTLVAGVGFEPTTFRL